MTTQVCSIGASENKRSLSNFNDLILFIGIFWWEMFSTVFRLRRDISILKGVIFRCATTHRQTSDQRQLADKNWQTKNISSCADSDKTARVQPNLTQLEYLWFCSDKIDVFSVMCVAMISVLSYLNMLSYMKILTCFVWCFFLFYYVIKMEIKQLKRFFFCLYFNPVLSRNSFTTSVLQMYIIENLIQQNSTCIMYFGDVTFWLCRTSDNSKYFLHSLGLWDNEVDLYM